MPTNIIMQVYIYMNHTTVARGPTIAGANQPPNYILADVNRVSNARYMHPTYYELVPT